jgi:putative ABC transport system permease protein
MFRNYLKTALRNLVRHKSFSAINLSGLALGMACSLLILMWVHDEYSMNAFHENGDRLYSVYERQYYKDKVHAFHSTPGILPDELKRIFPEVQYATGFSWMAEKAFEVNDKNIKVSGSYAGPDYFKMFSYKLLQGNAQTALSRVSDIAVSRSMAESFFGSAEAAINKTIRFDDSRDFTITTVYENAGLHESARFDYLINWQALLEQNPWMKDWNVNINNGPRTLIMLREGTDARSFEKRIAHFMDSYFKEQQSGFRIELGIQRFADMYLHGNFKEGKIAGGRIEYVRLFTLIAVFILLIACVNFMNLTTSRFMKRAKEIGVRKVAGALRLSIIRQFLGEALLIAGIAALMAVLLVYALLPPFNQLTQKQIALPFFTPLFWATIAALTIITGIVAGSYPAFFLSAFHPVKVLKGSMKAGPRAGMLRKGLVVFQFALSIILILGTIVVSQQINYIQSKNLGYNKANLVSVRLEGNLLNQHNYQLFKQEALSKGGIGQMTRILQDPINMDAGTSHVEWQNKNPDEKYLFTWGAVGYDFTKTMGLEMVDGRDFSRGFPTDSNAFIINESALKLINYKDPIGKKITFWGRPWTIVGVIKDFHFNSLHTPIRPLMLKLGENETWGNALVRIEGDKTEKVLANLEQLTKELNPKFPFTYQFVDEEYHKLYKGEQVTQKLSGYFAFLAIFICCLGLLGLVMFTIEQRVKEIGIRKVLGANSISLFGRLAKDLLTPVFVALAIALPAGWWAMQNWLDDFAYRISLNIWVFVLTAALVIIIALLSISFQAIKAVTANPMNALRSE